MENVFQNEKIDASSDFQSDYSYFILYIQKQPVKCNGSVELVSLLQSPSPGSRDQPRT